MRLVGSQCRKLVVSYAHKKAIVALCGMYTDRQWLFRFSPVVTGRIGVSPIKRKAFAACDSMQLTAPIFYRTQSAGATRKPSPKTLKYGEWTDLSGVRSGLQTAFGK